MKLEIRYVTDMYTDKDGDRTDERTNGNKTYKPIE